MDNTSASGAENGCSNQPGSKMRVIKYKNNAEIHLAVMVLKSGETIILPTDTVYGLCGDGFNEKVYEKIYQIKKRPQDKFFPLFVKDLPMTKEIAYLNPKQEAFLKNVWPGKVSVILRLKNKTLKKIFKNNTVALRAPNHHLILEIFEFVDFPIIGTSANISGLPDPIDPAVIINSFKNEKLQPDYILDYGILPESKSSTIIDLTTDIPQVIRRGAINAEHLIKLWTSL